MAGARARRPGRITEWRDWHPFRPPRGELPAKKGTKATPPPSLPAAPQPEPPPAPDSGWEEKTVARSGARLELLAEGGPLWEFTLGLTPATIGRSADCTIHVPSDSVSRRHAEVLLDSRGYVVRDLGSNNGTFVNEEQVTEAKLKDGDVVRIGLTSLVFRDR